MAPPLAGTGRPSCAALLLLLLLLCAGRAHAADPCPALAAQTAAPDPATRVAALACAESLAWYRPFIDRDGRLAPGPVYEAENTALAGGEPAWRKVAGYWQGSGLLERMANYPGAQECGWALAGSSVAPACRAFVVDHPWSAAFVSWVMVQARLPGFRGSASHIDYVRDAWRRPQQSAYLPADPFSTPPAAGDLLCHVRLKGQVLGYQGLARIAAGRAGLPMHCDVVVAANAGGDSTAWLVGGNVQQGVTLRILPLNRNGLFWGLPQRAAVDGECGPDHPAECNLDRQDWAVLLKLKPAAQLAQLPLDGLVPAGEATPDVEQGAAPAPAAPQCCVNCVVGSGVPRCPAAQPAPGTVPVPVQQQ
ncbi:MAG: DUF2272 domain-containing protein [Pseudoxanthomonas sp.]